ncbi:MAG: helix-turn-helix transcriptional regulator [Spirochaetales bacterium]|nr:helix-turn-helix transcriptional regulator [Spirochaetales bacterium]
MENLLKLKREVRNMTQEDLARSAGVTRQTIISLENGRYNPSLELAFKLAGIFRCTIEDIFIYGGNKHE